MLCNIWHPQDNLNTFLNYSPSHHQIHNKSVSFMKHTMSVSGFTLRDCHGYQKTHRFSEVGSMGTDRYCSGFQHTAAYHTPILQYCRYFTGILQQGEHNFYCFKTCFFLYLIIIYSLCHTVTQPNMAPPAASEHRGYGYTHGFCTGFVMGTGTGTWICTRTRTIQRLSILIWVISSFSFSSPNNDNHHHQAPPPPWFQHQTPTIEVTLWRVCHLHCHPTTLSFNHHHNHLPARAQQREREGREEEGEREEWRERGGARGGSETQ